MTEKSFWTIIEVSLAKSQTEQSEKLSAALSALSKDDLIAFEASYRDKLRTAYHWDLWAGAYIINGGCSDDGFDYFCDWLISRGQSVFENALKDPETLIDIATPWDTEYEDFRYIMIDVMLKKHQSDFPIPPTPRPTSPAGEEWDEEKVESKFPKLARWVQSDPPIKTAPSAIKEPKVSFWKRLFGKY